MTELEYSEEEIEALNRGNIIYDAPEGKELREELKRMAGKEA